MSSLQSVLSELETYGIATRDDVRGTVAAAHDALAAELRRRHPYGLGSYVFHMRDGGPLHLHASGPETARAARAACRAAGLAGVTVDLPSMHLLATA